MAASKSTSRGGRLNPFHHASPRSPYQPRLLCPEQKLDSQNEPSHRTSQSHVLHFLAGRLCGSARIDLGAPLQSAHRALSQFDGRYVLAPSAVSDQPLLPCRHARFRPAFDQLACRRALPSPGSASHRLSRPIAPASGSVRFLGAADASGIVELDRNGMVEWSDNVLISSEPQSEDTIDHDAGVVAADEPLLESVNQWLDQAATFANRLRSGRMPTNHNAAFQPYELYSFARKHGISVDCAREILEQFGADRVRSDLEALRFSLSMRRQAQTCNSTG